MKKPSLIIIACNIRSIFNVGAIFRTADALGAEKLYLAGNIATPKTQGLKLAKTALGAELTLPWQYIRKIKPVLESYKNQRYQIVALENRTKKQIDYRSWPIKDKTVILLGHEVNGISPLILKQCDHEVSLPMNGKKESLNVAVAFGALGYYWLSGQGLD